MLPPPPPARMTVKFTCLWFFFFFSSRRRHTRSTRDWSSDVCSPDLFNRLAVHGDVGEQRRRRQVVVPDRMVRDLKVPLALARLQIDTDERIAEEIVARPVAAVEI